MSLEVSGPTDTRGLSTEAAGNMDISSEATESAGCFQSLKSQYNLKNGGLNASASLGSRGNVGGSSLEPSNTTMALSMLGLVAQKTTSCGQQEQQGPITMTGSSY